MRKPTKLRPAKTQISLGFDQNIRCPDEETLATAMTDHFVGFVMPTTYIVSDRARGQCPIYLYDI